MGDPASAASLFGIGGFYGSPIPFSFSEGSSSVCFSHQFITESAVISTSSARCCDIS
jgi:hypothetical protein